jgi:hypothetical protein
MMREAAEREAEDRNADTSDQGGRYTVVQRFRAPPQPASGGGEPAGASAVIRELIDSAVCLPHCGGQRLQKAIAAAKKLLVDPLPAVAASGGGEAEVKVWGVVARQTNEVPPGCASPRRVSRKPVAWFCSQSEAEVFALSRNLEVVMCDAPPQPSSGGGEGGAMAWGVTMPGHETYGKYPVWSVRHTEELARRAFDAADGWIHFPLYRAPPQPRGWLTAEQRGVIKRVRNHLFDTSQLEFTDIVTLDDILDRLSPPDQPRGWLTEEQREALATVLFEAKMKYHKKYDGVIKAVESLLARSSPTEVVLVPACPIKANGTRGTELKMIGWAMAHHAWMQSIAASGLLWKLKNKPKGES